MNYVCKRWIGHSITTPCATVATRRVFLPQIQRILVFIVSFKWAASASMPWPHQIILARSLLDMPHCHMLLQDIRHTYKHSIASSHRVSLAEMFCISKVNRCNECTLVSARARNGPMDGLFVEVCIRCVCMIFRTSCNMFSSDLLCGVFLLFDAQYFAPLLHITCSDFPHSTMHFKA